nr:hypothetical protein GCM10020092_049270 [Actinoplanes digitatis]
MPAGDGEVVDPDGVQHDPEDGEEAERGALARGEQREPDRHRVDGHGHDQRDRERDQAGEPGTHPQDAEQNEEGHQRQDREEGGERYGVGDGVGHDRELIRHDSHP